MAEEIRTNGITTPQTNLGPIKPTATTAKTKTVAAAAADVGLSLKESVVAVSTPQQIAFVDKVNAKYKTAFKSFSDLQANYRSLSQADAIDADLKSFNADPDKFLNAKIVESIFFPDNAASSAITPSAGAPAAAPVVNPFTDTTKALDGLKEGIDDSGKFKLTGKNSKKVADLQKKIDEANKVKETANNEYNTDVEKQADAYEKALTDKLNAVLETKYGNKTDNIVGLAKTNKPAGEIQIQQVADYKAGVTEKFGDVNNEETDIKQYSTKFSGVTVTKLDATGMSQLNTAMGNINSSNNKVFELKGDKAFLQGLSKQISEIPVSVDAAQEQNRTLMTEKIRLEIEKLNAAIQAKTDARDTAIKAINAGESEKAKKAIAAKAELKDKTVPAFAKQKHDAIIAAKEDGKFDALGKDIDIAVSAESVGSISETGTQDTQLQGIKATLDADFATKNTAVEKADKVLSGGDGKQTLQQKLDAISERDPKADQGEETINIGDWFNKGADLFTKYMAIKSVADMGNMANNPMGMISTNLPPIPSFGNPTAKGADLSHEFEHLMGRVTADRNKYVPGLADNSALTTQSATAAVQTGVVKAPDLSGGAYASLTDSRNSFFRKA